MREFPSLHLFNFIFLINSSTRLLAWLPLFILDLSSLFLFLCSLLEARSVTVINIITPTSLLFIFSSKLPQRENIISNICLIGEDENKTRETPWSTMSCLLALLCFFFLLKRSSLFSFIYLLFIHKNSVFFLVCLT